MAEFHQVDSLDITKETDKMQRIVIKLKRKDMPVSNNWFIIKMVYHAVNYTHTSRVLTPH